MKVVLHDVTSNTWRDRLPIPDGVGMPQFSSAVCLKDPATCLKGTNRKDVKDPAFFHLPLSFVEDGAVNWDPLAFDGSPISAGGNFVKKQDGAIMTRANGWMFVEDPLFSNGELNVKMTSPALPKYNVRVFRVEYGSSTDVWPMSIAVAVPEGLTAERPATFLVYLQNTPLQDPDQPIYRFFKPPFGWDWTYHQYWRWLNYTFPLFAGQWNAFGLPYQLTHSGRPVVLVIPQIPPDNLAQDPAQFSILSGQTLLKLLRETQNVVLPGAGPELAAVVLAAFSDGNLVLANMLDRNLKAKKGSDDFRFITESVAEIYCFDPPQRKDLGNLVIECVLRWKKKNVRDGIIRFYSQFFYDPGYGHLLPSRTAAGPQVGRAFFGESADNTVTLAYVPRRDDGGDVWMAGCRRLFGKACTMGKVSGDDVHHWIPALFLTDARRRSRYPVIGPPPP